MRAAARLPFATFLLACLLLPALPAARRASASAPAPAPAVEELKVTLKPSGFEPAEAARDAGHVRLTVSNRSGSGGLTFRVLKMTGQEVYHSQAVDSDANWTQDIDLPAGRYVLTEAAHPDWHFYINML